MPAGQATFQVRQTTTTTTSRASVLVINTGYLGTRLGLLKLILLILSLICFILLILEAHQYVYRRDYYYAFYYSCDWFLLLVSFAVFFTVTIMLISCLLSLGTATLLPKTSFDFFFHFIGFVLFLIAGIWVSIDAFDQRKVRIQIACVLAFFCAIIQLIHGIFSYKMCITN